MLVSMMFDGSGQRLAFRENRQSLGRVILGKLLKTIKQRLQLEYYVSH